MHRSPNRIFGRRIGAPFKEVLLGYIGRCLAHRLSSTHYQSQIPSNTHKMQIPSRRKKGVSSEAPVPGGGRRHTRCGSRSAFLLPLFLLFSGEKAQTDWFVSCPQPSLIFTCGGWVDSDRQRMLPEESRPATATGECDVLMFWTLLSVAWFGKAVDWFLGRFQQ